MSAEHDLQRFDGLTSDERMAVLDRMDELIRNAMTCLTGMRLDCTRTMRVDEVSDAESRRVVALGYLSEARDESAALIAIPKLVVKRNGP